ncbi:MAG: BatA and WFA domain-containing protein [Gemmatimonadetes bacterium]|nr:BatA and WFA domain-containing protein [Gemmatimonadota bacterium]
MAFLAPWFLALAAVAGVPIFLHLLRRRIGRTVDFPAVRYLARMEQEHSRELKLRNRLLLILRVLAVLALALAAARPIARRIGFGHAPVALALVVDNSMSSGLVLDGRPRLDALRTEARELLGALGPDDRAWLVTADGRITGGAPSALTDALDRLTPLAARGDLAGAVRRALALARSGAPRAPLVALATDGQASSLRADSVVQAADVPVVVLGVGAGAPRNRAVLSAVPAPARWTPGGAVSLAITSPDATAWRLTLDGRTVARGDVPAAPATAPARAEPRLASAASGWLRGSVELEADALRADDTRWFAVRVAPPPTVAVRGESGPFLAAALGTLVDEKRLARGTLGAPRVVTVSGADAAGVRSPVFLTAPQDPIRIGDANRELTRLGIPWRFGAIARGQVLARAAGLEAQRDSLSATVRAFEDTPVRLRYPLVYSPGGNANAAAVAADTLATAGGTPWVVAGNGYVLVGSPIDPEATDLPLRAAFVPWLLEALARQLGEDGRLIEAAPGSTLTGVRDATGLERPDSTVLPLDGDRLVVPAEPGVYFLRRQNARIGAIVVNADAAESDLRGTAAGEQEALGSRVQALVAGAKVQATASGSAWRAATFSHAAGQALLLPLVALALVALLAEAWIGGR